MHPGGGLVGHPPIPPAAAVPPQELLLGGSQWALPGNRHAAAPAAGSIPSTDVAAGLRGPGGGAGEDVEHGWLAAHGQGGPREHLDWVLVPAAVHRLQATQSYT